MMRFLILTYRITFQNNFEKCNSKKLFVFGTAETKNIEKKFINGISIIILYKRFLKLLHLQIGLKKDF